MDWTDYYRRTFSVSTASLDWENFNFVALLNAIVGDLVSQVQLSTVETLKIQVHSVRRNASHILRKHLNITLQVETVSPFNFQSTFK